MVSRLNQTTKEEKSMASPVETSQMDAEIAERLSQQFAEVFQTLDAGEQLFSPEAFFDLNMPVWRFQLQGHAVQKMTVP